MYINLSETIDKRKALMLARETGTDDICATLLISRGLDDPEKAKKFLFGKVDDFTSPFEYSGMEQATEEIKSVIRSGGKILFYGDYDCDGIGAVAILTRAFRGKGVNTDYYIPVRADEGYGLNCEAIEKIKQNYDPQLIITVDCGITSLKEVKLAHELGMKIIVTDHHHPGNDLPDCTVINPCLNCDLTQLCGAGVAFMLVRALFGDIYAFKFIDICAISTVADIVPLLGDNRLIVKFGLETIRKGRYQVGIKQLIEKSNLNCRFVDSGDIAFKIAPRLNAAGRLETAKTSAQLMITDDITEASLLATELSMQNAERQEIGKKIYAGAMNSLKSYDFSKYKIIVLYDKEWNEGVNGIAAARLAEYFNLPTILMTKKDDGTLKGSARSIAGVNIYDAISSQMEKLISFGGHAMAAGLSLREEDFDDFKNGINDYILKNIPEETFIRKTVYDMGLSIKLINRVTLKNVQLLEPFGYKNPAPVFLDNGSSIDFSVLKRRHLKASNGGMDIVAFGLAPMLPAYNSTRTRKLLYCLEKNSFNGECTDRVRIKNIDVYNFNVPDEALQKRAVEFIFNSRESEDMVAKKPNGGAELHVFFTNGQFKRFKEAHPEMKVVYAECSQFDFCDAMVLAPDTDFPFVYFGKITVHGMLPETTRRYFAKMGAEFADTNEKILDLDFDIVKMRETYKALREMLRRKCNFDGLEEIYKQKEIADLSVPEPLFYLYFYIMSEVKLLKWKNDDILECTGEKVDLKESVLYGYING